MALYLIVMHVEDYSTNGQNMQTSIDSNYKIQFDRNVKQPTGIAPHIFSFVYNIHKM